MLRCVSVAIEAVGLWAHSEAKPPASVRLEELTSLRPFSSAYQCFTCLWCEPLLVDVKAASRGSGNARKSTKSNLE